MNEKNDEDKLETLYSKYDRTAKKIIIVLAILCMSQFGLGVWNLSLSKDNNLRTSEIQSSRRNSILISCEEQNTRNENTVNTLEDLIGKAKFNTAIEMDQLDQTKTFTILLINALAPKQNCKARVAKLTKP